MPTLAQIVNDNPNAARVLERHRLDYCCGGRQTLESACEAGGVDIEVVLQDLAAQPTAEGDWVNLGIAELVDHIESTHHRYLHEELPRLVALATKVRDVHSERHPELTEVARVVTALHHELEPHMLKEEQVLFPMIRELAASEGVPSFHCGSLANPIRVMLVEHDQAGELLDELRTLTGDHQPPADACGSYKALYSGIEQVEADTHLHVHKENNLLFPTVIDVEHRRSAP